MDSPQAKPDKRLSGSSLQQTSLHWLTQPFKVDIPVESDLPSPEQIDLLWKMWEFGDASQKRIADKLSIEEKRLSQILHPLKVKGWIRDERVFEMEAMGFDLRYRIDVKIAPVVLAEHIQQYKGETDKGIDNPQEILVRYIVNKLGVPQDLQGRPRLLVEDAYILLGDDADLSLTVRAKEHSDVFQWVTRRLRGLPGVENTSTCLEAWHYRGGKLSEERKRRTKPARSPHRIRD
jgi:DNA-binding Lrp family transcriptional regulator